MLACVCQPADTTRLFGAAGTRSPVNLGAVPKSRPLRPPKPCASSTKNTASSSPAATFTRETADCNLSRSALDVASKPHPPSPTAGGDASVKINTEIASTTSSPIRYYSDKEQTSKEYYINFSASNFVPNTNVLTVTTCSANIETKSNVGVTDTAKKQSDINNVKSLTNVEKTNMTNNSSKAPVSNTVKLRTDVMPNIPNCKETKNTSVSKQMRPLKMCSSSITSPVRVHSVIKHANSNSLSSSSSCSSITGTKSASGSDDQTKILPTISPKNVKTTNNTPSNASNFEKLPDGVALTLGELRDMAWRQQHQLEAQHRLLAAREQRLRHLKEQEMARVAGENERLRRLRERVDAQELKLRRLRALRGQVDHAKHNNALLTSDLESIRALFNEKEKELSVAVAKVDELTRQLEELRRGRQSEPPTGASLELEKLRRELMYRNKFNEQQNAKLSQQREALTQRQEEIINIDKRISELQDRLNRKRVLNQQLANQIASTNKTTNQVQPNPSMIQQNPPMLLENPHPILTKQHSRGNIAAIEPYNHVPLPTPDQNHFVEKPKQPASAFFTQTNSNQVNQNNANNLKPQKQEEPAALKAPNEQVKNESNDFIAEFNGSKSDPKYQTLPYNTKFSVNFVSTTKVNKDVQLQDADKNINEADSVQNVNSKATHQPHMTVHSTPLSTINKGLAVPLSQNDNTYHDKFMQQKQQNELKNALHHLEQPPRALHPHNGSARGQPVGGPSTSSSSISTVINNNNLNINQQKPISSVAPTSLHLGSNKPSAIYQTSSMKIQPVQPQTIQTTLQTPSYSHNTNGNIHAQQMVLTPPNSTSTPLGTPDTIPKPVLPPKPAIKPPPRQMQPITDLDKDITPPPIPTSEPPQESIPSNQQVKQHDNKPIKARPLTIKKQPLGEQQPKLRNIPKLNGVHVSINRRIEMPPAFLFPEMSTPPSDLISINQNENTNNSNKTTVNNNTIDNLTQSKSNTQQKSQDETDKAVPDDKISELEEENKKNVLDKVPMNVGENLVVRRNKGNLKQNGKVNLSRRVSFDPLALLLDASLEGELELVKKTATQVTNPSAANDEGITALHNAICAGHLEIVQFLVEFGCDVNAQDSDGWTPLHCAASCNNVAMVKFLVEHGACIFATTLSDHETAAEKCEEDEEGFDGCSEYLYSVQEKLGILSGGAVFAVFDYVAQQADELNFSAGQQLTVLRKGDENEREWWWARLGDKEGYIPRNLLGLYPRVIPKSE